VLSVESILDVLVHVDLVDDLVCIVLESSCEDHYFIELGHKFYEVDATGPY
jgi:hypothetical protein